MKNPSISDSQIVQENIKLQRALYKRMLDVNAATLKRRGVTLDGLNTAAERAARTLPRQLRILAMTKNRNAAFEHIRGDFEDAETALQQIAVYAYRQDLEDKIKNG